MKTIMNDVKKAMVVFGVIAAVTFIHNINEYAKDNRVNEIEFCDISGVDENGNALFEVQYTTRASKKKDQAVVEEVNFERLKDLVWCAKMD